MSPKKKEQRALYYNPDEGEVQMRETAESEIFTVLNQRWTLLVLRCLVDAPIRFNELSKLAGLNPNTLRERLRDLEGIGVIERKVISTNPPKVEYRLTPNGKELVSVFGQFNVWLSKHAVVFEQNRKIYAAEAARPTNPIS